MRHPFAILPLFLTLALALPAAAQHTIDGIAWGTPAPGVRGRLEAGGWRFRGVDQDGDHVFGGRDGAELVAMFDSAGVVRMELTWRGSAAAVRRRYRSMDDSLRRALGRPTREENTAPTWERGDASLYILLADEPSSRRPGPFASLTGEGPGFLAEVRRRSLLSLEEAQRAAASPEVSRDTARGGAWRQVAARGRTEITLDSLSVVAVGPGVYRARMTEEWWWALRMVDGRKYMGEVREVEIDCPRLRMRRTRTARGSAESAVEALPRLQPGAWVEWTAPAAASLQGEALRASCAVLPALARAVPR